MYGQRSPDLTKTDLTVMKMGVNGGVTDTFRDDGDGLKGPDDGFTLSGVCDIRGFDGVCPYLA